MFISASKANLKQEKKIVFNFFKLHRQCNYFLRARDGIITRHYRYNIVNMSVTFKQALKWQAANTSPTPAEIHTHAFPYRQRHSRGTETRTYMCSQTFRLTDSSAFPKKNKRKPAQPRKTRISTQKKKSTKSPIS